LAPFLALLLDDLTPPVAGAVLRAAKVASCLRGALAPVLMRAVCFVLAIYFYYFIFFVNYFFFKLFLFIIIDILTRFISDKMIKYCT
jgi:hypothetical protein